MKPKESSPIGIFDSGIGGLTVAKAISERLPRERLIYFGDTAHLPYGEKSAAAIQAYSVKITNVLIEEGCKLIVIACNSASSAAYDLLREYSGSRAKIINVIDPMVDFVLQNYPEGSVGLIGTRQTIGSNIYKKKLLDRNANFELKSLATPLLVPMIEEGFIRNKISKDVLDQYLSHSDFEKIKSIILGCTHYPLIKDEISRFFLSKVDVISSSDIVAQQVSNFLTENSLLSASKKHKDKFLVSDYTDSFEASSQYFFGKSIHLEEYPLWE